MPNSRTAPGPEAERLRILLVITELDPGGAERCLVNLAIYLVSRGHNVRVLALGPEPHGKGRLLVDQLERHRIDVDFGGARSILSLPRLVLWVRRFALEFRPDITQTMLFHANVVGGLAIPNGVGLRFGGVRVRQLERWRCWLERWAMRSMRRVVCVSQDVADHCAKVQGISTERIVVIPNGFDFESRKEGISSIPPWQSLAIPTGVPTLLFVGRLHPQKGIDQLLSKMSNWMDSHPTAHFMILGQGPLEANLRIQIGKMKCGDRVHLVGWQASPEVWMRHATLLVLPTLFEGMPNVVLEAMGNRLPVVAFEVDGIRDLLGPRGNREADSQIAPAGDFDVFLQRVSHLSEETDLRNACMESNLLRVRRDFDLNAQLARYQRLYLEQLRAVKGGTL